MELMKKRIVGKIVCILSMLLESDWVSLDEIASGCGDTKQAIDILVSHEIIKVTGDSYPLYSLLGQYKQEFQSIESEISKVKQEMDKLRSEEAKLWEIQLKIQKRDEIPIYLGICDVLKVLHTEGAISTQEYDEIQQAVKEFFVS